MKIHLLPTESRSDQLVKSHRGWADGRGHSFTSEFLAHFLEGHLSSFSLVSWLLNVPCNVFLSLSLSFSLTCVQSIVIYPSANSTTRYEATKGRVSTVCLSFPELPLTQSSEGITKCTHFSLALSQCPKLVHTLHVNRQKQPGFSLRSP